ncbi:unnamed protein product [Ambrosiozyma monospora]|uniref:Unnamed protein product n=1 Tax=Ambrosiozyma monospora TaxID=43982 RepID=A0ACB5T2J2_AMBMO|nr:unnamed protein product [Ambrosiozyma monospora]
MTSPPKYDSSPSSLEESFDKAMRQQRWLSFMFSKEVPPIPLDDERKIHPMYRSNFLSRTMFWWVTPLMKVGYERIITPEDLFKLDDTMEIEKLSETFEGHLMKRITYYQNRHLTKRYQERNETPETSTVDRETDLEDFILPRGALFMALFHTFCFQSMKGIAQMSLQAVGTALQPLLLKKLTDFVELQTLELNLAVGKGIGYSIGTTFVIGFTGVMVNHAFYNSMMVGAKAKSVLIRTILKKSFALNQLGHHNAPFGVVVGIALLIHSIGVYALIGIAFFFVCSIILGIGMNTLIKLRKQSQVHTDMRVTLVEEILKNFKIIKYYCWEVPYLSKITELRNKETKKVFQLQTVRNILYSLVLVLPVLTSMTTFCVLFGVRKDKVTPGSIFASLAWFGALSNAFIRVPISAAECADASVALGRAAEFLSQGETVPAEKSDTISLESKLAVNLNNASFQWPEFDLKDSNKDIVTMTIIIQYASPKKNKLLESETKSIEVNSTRVEKFSGLHNVNLEIMQGEFVVITGSIGSGKSSLLAAIAGTMTKTEGDVTVNGTFLSCGYPWD